MTRAPAGEPVLEANDDREVRVSSLAGIIGRYDRRTWRCAVDEGLVPSRDTTMVRVADAQTLVDEYDGIHARQIMDHIDLPGDAAITVRHLADQGVRSADVIAEGALVGYAHDGVDGVADPRKDSPEMVAALVALGLRVALAAEHYRRLGMTAQ